jgi:hypothetical protein
MPADRFFGAAAEELASGNFDRDLFARCYAIALGDSEKSKAVYIAARAERLEKMWVLMSETAEKMAKEEAKRIQREAKARAAKERSQASEATSRMKTEEEAEAARKDRLERERIERARIFRSSISKDASASGNQNKEAQSKLPGPTDFQDPSVREAVDAMRRALDASRFK